MDMGEGYALHSHGAASPDKEVLVSAVNSMTSFNCQLFLVSETDDNKSMLKTLGRVPLISSFMTACSCSATDPHMSFDDRHSRDGWWCPKTGAREREKLICNRNFKMVIKVVN